MMLYALLSFVLFFATWFAAAVATWFILRRHLRHPVLRNRFGNTTGSADPPAQSVTSPAGGRTPEVNPQGSSSASPVMPGYGVTSPSPIRATPSAGLPPAGRAGPTTASPLLQPATTRQAGLTTAMCASPLGAPASTGASPVAKSDNNRTGFGGPQGAVAQLTEPHSVPRTVRGVLEGSARFTARWVRLRGEALVRRYVLPFVHDRTTKVRAWVTAPAQQAWVEQNLDLIWVVGVSFVAARALWSLGTFQVVELLFLLGATNMMFRARKRDEDALIGAAQLAMRHPQVAARVLQGNMPAWLSFPSVDRAEWLTQTARHAWPWLGKAIERTLQELLQEEIDEQLEEVSSSIIRRLSLSEVSLGTTPPQVTGLQVHLDAPNETMLDVYFQWWSDDSNVAFSLDVGPLSDLRIQLSDFRADIIVRFILGPHVHEWPCFRDLGIAFVGKPNLRYSLRAGSIPVDIVPGLSSTLDTVVSEAIMKFVYPRQKVIPLLDRLKRHKAKRDQQQYEYEQFTAALSAAVTGHVGLGMDGMAPTGSGTADSEGAYFQDDTLGDTQRAGRGGDGKKKDGKKDAVSRGSHRRRESNNSANSDPSEATGGAGLGNTSPGAAHIAARSRKTDPCGFLTIRIERCEGLPDFRFSTPHPFVEMTVLGSPDEQLVAQSEKPSTAPVFDYVGRLHVYEGRPPVVRAVVRDNGVISDKELGTCTVNLASVVAAEATQFHFQRDLARTKKDGSVVAAGRFFFSVYYRAYRRHTHGDDQTAAAATVPSVVPAAASLRNPGVLRHDSVSGGGALGDVVAAMCASATRIADASSSPRTMTPPTPVPAVPAVPVSAATPVSSVSPVRFGAAASFTPRAGAESVASSVDGPQPRPPVPRTVPSTARNGDALEASARGSLVGSATISGAFPPPPRPMQQPQAQTQPPPPPLPAVRRQASMGPSELTLTANNSFSGSTALAGFAASEGDAGSLSGTGRFNVAGRRSFVPSLMGDSDTEPTGPNGADFDGGGSPASFAGLRQPPTQRAAPPVPVTRPIAGGPSTPDVPPGSRSVHGSVAAGSPTSTPRGTNVPLRFPTAPPPLAPITCPSGRVPADRPRSSTTPSTVPASSTVGMCAPGPDATAKTTSKTSQSTSSNRSAGRGMVTSSLEFGTLADTAKCSGFGAAGGAGSGVLARSSNSAGGGGGGGASTCQQDTRPHPHALCRPGTLLITGIHAQQLHSSDGDSVINPYVTCSIGSSVARTPIARRTANPRWTEIQLKVDVENGAEDVLRVCVYADRSVGRDLLLGTVEIRVEDVMHSNGRLQDKWPLRPYGMVAMELRLLLT